MRIRILLMLLFLPAIAEAFGFLPGVDLSFLQQVEEAGGVYRNASGQADDAVSIFSAAGVTATRLRLWVDPVDNYNNLDRVAATAIRSGRRLLLDIHYSDTWADPGRQDKPAAWAALSFDDLRQQVHTYTHDVITALVDQGVTLEMVQVGNEITSGFLWPDGMLSPNTDSNWPAFAELIGAATQAVRLATPAGEHIDIMLHIDNGGNNDLARWFFDNAVASNLDFDVIGVSFYPWWHGTLTDLEANLNDIAARYEREVVVAETAYPWTLAFDDNTHNLVGLENQLHPGYPATPDGQRDFVTAVREIVQNVPAGRGRGLFYWAADWIATDGFGSAWENLALFDFAHQPLPAMAAIMLPVTPLPIAPTGGLGGGGSAFYVVMTGLLLLILRRVRPGPAGLGSSVSP